MAVDSRNSRWSSPVLFCPSSPWVRAAVWSWEPARSRRALLVSADSPLNPRCPTMPYDDGPIVGYIRQAHDTALLAEREKHLVGLAVTMTRGCQVCTRNRIEKARAAGIGDDVLNALVNVVSAVNAGVTA